MVINGQDDLKKVFKEEIDNKSVLQGVVYRVHEENVMLKVNKNGFAYYPRLLRKDIAPTEAKSKLVELFQKGDMVLFKIKGIQEEILFADTKDFYNVIMANNSLRGKNYTNDVSAEKTIESIKDRIRAAVGSVSEPAENKMYNLLNEVGIVAFVQIMNDEITKVDTDPSLTLMNQIERASKERGCL